MSAIRKRSFFESSRILYLSIDAISPNPNQPRTRFSRDGLEELASSIRVHGILQPLSVRKTDTGYQLISGERRLRAARLAQLSQVPCLLVSADELESSLLALIENLQRRDLDFVEEATALQTLLSTYHLSQEEAAQKLGKSQSAIANKLRLLRLSPECLTLLREHGLSERHGRCLLRLPEGQRMDALRQIIGQGLTVSKTEALVDRLLAPAPHQRKTPIYLMKDVRLFFNSLNRNLEIMRHAGIAATCVRQDTDTDILLTITIPQFQSKPQDVSRET